MIHNADVNTLEHLAAVKSARAQKDAADHAALAEAPRRKLSVTWITRAVRREAEPEPLSRVSGKPVEGAR
ncbi:MAG: hypothetical protein ACSLFM_04105 [Tepidiformaceae bacterium]